MVWCGLGGLGVLCCAVLCCMLCCAVLCLVLTAEEESFPWWWWWCGLIGWDELEDGGWRMDYGLWTVDCGLRTADCGLWTVRMSRVESKMGGGEVGPESTSTVGRVTWGQAAVGTVQ